MNTLRVALEWFLNPDHLPFIVAEAQGWFAEEGLQITLIEPKEHFDAFEAFAADELDIAITEPIHLLQDLAQGQELRGFARFLHTNGGVMVLGKSGITRPIELAGKRIQYPGAPGPGGPAIINTMIVADGGTASELTPVNHGFLHTDALEKDLADAATLVFYNFEIVEARHKGLEPKMFALKDYGVPDFCQLILVTPPAILEQRKQDLERFVQVLRRGIDFVKQQPKEAAAIYWKKTGANPEDPLGKAIFEATVPCFSHDFGMSQDYYQKLATWLVETKQAEEIPGLESCWTNQFAY